MTNSSPPPPDDPPPPTLRAALDDSWRMMGEVVEEQRARPTLQETGQLVEVDRGVALARGLPHARADELLRFAGGEQGIAFDLDEHGVGCVLLDHGDTLRAGTRVERTGRVVDTPVGDALLGRVIDPLGRPLDGGREPVGLARRPCEREAPAIMERAAVTVPLHTGLKVVDALIPIGRGQRQLILGDRQTGKTALAVDTILRQRDGDVVCVYCSVGQRSTSVARVVASLRGHEAMERTIVVVGADDAPPGLQFIAPYAATTIGEHFMAQGRDVLVVYDDLTAHARAYRHLSLALRRPPGREAYAGDIFYIHSRLLERSARLRPQFGGGSLTALPIVETEAQNVSAYIPTNLISITDGQIYLSPRLFQKGVLPAVDVGRSVSRVGGKAQLPAYRAVAGDLRLLYTQFEELEKFARFSRQLDEDTRETLERGRRVREALKQAQFQPLGVPEQIATLLAVTSGALDRVGPESIPRIEPALWRAVRDDLPEIAARITHGEKLPGGDLERMRVRLDEVVAAVLEEERRDAAEASR